MGSRSFPLWKNSRIFKLGLNDTYIDVILQSLPPSYDPFVVNYNMNGFEKSINELINMLVQYEATTKKSEPSVLVREASTSKAKGREARRWKRKKGKAKAAASALSAPVPVAVGKGKGREGRFHPTRRMMSAYIAGKGYWRECPSSSPVQIPAVELTSAMICRCWKEAEN
ncbi:UNVERIFIED_CONTAM: hypothetical protein Sradi_5738200 [Sesamum radiatum]|uniref:Uncharacterized protein n=1 Tax=Sesamum radiatum TaxID=300843 RepID=A0AAW2L475_SESRA